MDEKGLAAIFVFGLPGFGQHNHALMCLKSSLAILDAMGTGGMDIHGGLATGTCFCGLVGDQTQRCEYSVLGGKYCESMWSPIDVLIAFLRVMWLWSTIALVNKCMSSVID